MSPVTLPRTADTLFIKVFTNWRLGRHIDLPYRRCRPRKKRVLGRCNLGPMQQFDDAQLDGFVDVLGLGECLISGSRRCGPTNRLRVPHCSLSG